MVDIIRGDNGFRVVPTGSPGESPMVNEARFRAQMQDEVAAISRLISDLSRRLDAMMVRLEAVSTVAADAPENPTQGDFWVSTVNLRNYVYDGTVWVDVTPTAIT